MVKIKVENDELIDNSTFAGVQPVGVIQPIKAFDDLAVKGYSTKDTMASAVEDEYVELSSEKMEKLKKAEMAELAYRLEKNLHANFEKMLDAALRVVAIQMRMSGRFDHEQIQIFMEKAKEHVSNVQKTYNTVGGVAFLLIGSVGMLACSALGMFNMFGGHAFFAGETSKKIGEAVLLGNGASQSVTHIGGIFTEKAAADRYARENAHKRHETQQGDMSQSLQQFRQQVNALMRQVAETQQSGHDAKQRQGQ